MSSYDLSNKNKQAVSMLELLKGRTLQVLGWPVLCLVLLALIWFWTLSKIDAEKHNIEKKALGDASALCRDYEQYLIQVIEQINSSTLQLKYSWEQSHGSLNLHDMLQSGMFSNAHIVNVLIANRQGISSTSTLPDPQKISIADRNYFLFHQSDDSSALQIGRPMLGRLSARPVIPFSRRLNTIDGKFDGVEVVSIEPSHLTSFYAGSFPGKSGLLAVAGLDGVIRSAQIGNTMQYPTLSTLLRAVPLFSSMEGATYLSEDSTYGDKQARFIAWKTLKDYPLLVMVGISKQEYFAPYLGTWRTYKIEAISASILLILFSLMATGVSIRIARKKHLEEEVLKTYRLATEGGDEGFYMYEALSNKNGTIVDFELVDCNARGAEFIGMNSKQLQHAKLSSLFPAIYFDDFLNTFREAMLSGFHEDEYMMPRESNSNIVWAKRRLVRFGTGLAVTVQDITERKTAEEKINHLAFHDPLTLLPNRNLLLDRLQRAVASCSRSGRAGALLYIDLDNFKMLNDTLGHAMGDLLLQQVAIRLAACVREGDTVARLGGDEFVVILEELSEKTIEAAEQAEVIGEKIRDALSQIYQLNTHVFRSSCSIGATLFSGERHEAEELLKQSDIAMYQAKKAGRNTLRFFDPQMQHTINARSELEGELHKALDNRQFHLYYQTQVDRSFRPFGAEALIRWIHPERGLISPAHFIPLAEETGLILPIGLWVLDTACAQIKDWARNEQTRNLVMSVNISARQFHQTDFVPQVRDALQRHAISPNLLKMELTESMLLEDIEATIAKMNELKSIGVQLSLDDFGTGYSSLQYLKLLPLNQIKIDQSFVRNIATDSNDAAIVQTIIAMTEALGLDVIAEGVETEAQREFLVLRGCHAYQGYLFGRPMPIEQFDALITQH